jgi:hypothetical protein
VLEVDHDVLALSNAAHGRNEANGRVGLDLGAILAEERFWFWGEMNAARASLAQSFPGKLGITCTALAASWSPREER